MLYRLVVMITIISKVVAALVLPTGCLDEEAVGPDPSGGPMALLSYNWRWYRRPFSSLMMTMIDGSEIDR